MKRTLTIIAVITAALAGALYVFARRASPAPDTNFAALAPACHGRAPPASPSFVVWGPVHRVVAFDDDGTTHLRPDLVPAPNRSPSVGETQIVLCLGARTTQTVETCGSTPRTQVVRPIRAVSPSTGGTLAQGTLAGPLPPACGTTPGSDLTGHDPTANEIGAWLTAHVP